MSLSCLTPTIRRSCLTVFLKFRSQEPLKMLRNLSLNLWRGPWRFWSRLLRGMESLKKASRHCRTTNGTNSKQKLHKEVWGHLLATKRFWRRWGLGPARVQCSVSSSHLYCWTLQIMIQMTHLQVIRNFFLVKFSFVSSDFCKFFMCIFSLGQSRLPRTALPTLTLHFWENLSWFTLSQLM